MTDATEESGASKRRVTRVDGRWFLLAAAVVVGLVAWRATLGMSLSDDGYYAATTVRLAQGARLFVDEMYLQSLGFLAAIPFAKLWLWLFGTTGVVVALRVYYVVVAAIAGALVFRVLDRSFGRTAAFVGAVAVWVAPTYNVLSVSYDTMAALGITLACVFCFAAVRDGRRRYAVVAGAAAAFAAVSHPPFVLPSIALLITFAVFSRDRRLLGAMLLGAVAVAGAFLLWLFATTSLAELRGAYDFVISIFRGTTTGPAKSARIGTHLQQFLTALSAVWIVPLFVWFAPAAAISAWTAYIGPASERARARGVALGMLPVALAVPAFAYWMARGHHLVSLETLGGNLLIAFVVFAVAPMYTSLRQGPSDARRALVLMSLPAALTGFAVVLLSSSADIFWASGIVGLAPLVVAVVVWWAVEVRHALGMRAEMTAVASLLVALLLLLFGYGFKTDGSPLNMPAMITEGAYAGVRVGTGRAAQLAEIERLADKWVGPTTTVTSVGLPGAYLITDGKPLTNVTWLDPGSFDQSTVDYLDRAGRWPDVVFVQLARLNKPTVVRASPFLAVILSRYTLVERSTVGDVAVFTSSGLKPATP